MLNLMPPPATGHPIMRRDIQWPMALGLLLGLLYPMAQEMEASKALSSDRSITASNSQLALASSVAVLPAAQAEAQEALSLRRASLTFLERRQAQRDDVTEVQEIWLLSRLGSSQAAVKLQAQQWQMGQFSWEGVAAHSGHLDTLLHRLNRFSRWAEAPVLVRLQPETPVQNLGSSVTGLTFQLQASVHSQPGRGS